MEAPRDRTIFRYPLPARPRAALKQALVHSTQQSSPTLQAGHDNKGLEVPVPRHFEVSQSLEMFETRAIDTPVEAMSPHMSIRQCTERDLCLPAAAHQRPVTIHERFVALHAKKEDMITVIISSSQVEFDLPREALATTSRLWSRRFYLSQSKREGAIPTPCKEYRADNFSLPAFSDYTNWLYSGKILRYSHNGVPYAIDSAARRLVEALGFGLRMEAESYQHAALQELFHLGPHLATPEDYIDSIFSTMGIIYNPEECGSKTRRAVRKWKPHPACWLVVAIVAAKREGTGRDPIQYEKVHDKDFIRMFSWWYRSNRGQETGGCQYPSTLTEALIGL